jgi:hypothetical protein
MATISLIGSHVWSGSTLHSSVMHSSKYELKVLKAKPTSPHTDDMFLWPFFAPAGSAGVRGTCDMSGLS